MSDTMAEEIENVSKENDRVRSRAGNGVADGTPKKLYTLRKHHGATAHTPYSLYLPGGWRPKKVASFSWEARKGKDTSDRLWLEFSRDGQSTQVSDTDFVISRDIVHRKMTEEEWAEQETKRKEAEKRGEVKASDEVHDQMVHQVVYNIRPALTEQEKQEKQETQNVQQEARTSKLIGHLEWDKANERWQESADGWEMTIAPAFEKKEQSRARNLVRIYVEMDWVTEDIS